MSADDHISGGSGTDTLILGGDSEGINLGGYGAGTYTISTGSTIDTITIDPSWNNIGSITLPTTTSSTFTTGTSYTYNTTGYTNSVLAGTSVNIGSNGIDMAAGTDIKMDGKSLKEFMTKMEERLAILVPDPAKLEKFEALKKAYEHYKLMEKLCQEEPPEGEE